MTAAPTIVAVCGSLRDASYTRTALAYVLDAAADAGAETELIDLRDHDLPVYDPDGNEPAVATALRRRIRAADGVALGSPVYHSSYSAAFRNLHDYCSYDDYEETVVGLVATAGGGSYGSTLEHMRSTLRGVHAWVLPRQVGIRNASEKFVADAGAIDGRAFADERLAERVETLGADLAHYAASGPAARRELASRSS